MAFSLVEGVGSVYETLHEISFITFFKTSILKASESDWAL